MPPIVTAQKTVLMTDVYVPIEETKSPSIRAHVKHKRIAKI
jgi:hypothetical protein